MTTRRAKRHQWIVLRQKAFRYFKRHRGSYYYVWDSQRMGGPRWRTIGRVQTEYERMVSVLHTTRRNLPQGKMEPLGLLQFVKADWTPKEDNHDD
ncbi:hypothetical protein ACLUWM_05035 [Limosilactobacillus mucosae]